MSDYASQTVASLKEILKSRGLAVDGKKADLVQRLTENDAQSGDKPAEPNGAPAPEEELKEDVATETQPESVTDAPSVDAAPAEAKPEKKVLSPEERKKMAVELLEKKIKRAEKFGDDAAAEASRKDLARIEKFGVEAGTTIAGQIGLEDRTLADSIKSGKKRSPGGKGFRSRVNKQNKN